MVTMAFFLQKPFLFGSFLCILAGSITSPLCDSVPRRGKLIRVISSQGWQRVGICRKKNKFYLHITHMWPWPWSWLTNEFPSYFMPWIKIMVIIKPFFIQNILKIKWGNSSVTNTLCANSKCLCKTHLHSNP